DMDYCSSRKIQRWNPTAKRSVKKATRTPDHVRQREINDGDPQRGKEQHGAEFHAFRERAADQCRRDNPKNKLKQQEGLLRYGSAIDGIGFTCHAAKEDEAEATYKRISVRKCQTVSIERPDHADRGHQDEA